MLWLNFTCYGSIFGKPMPAAAAASWGLRPQQSSLLVDEINNHNQTIPPGNNALRGHVHVKARYDDSGIAFAWRSACLSARLAKPGASPHRHEGKNKKHAKIFVRVFCFQGRPAKKYRGLSRTPATSCTSMAFDLRLTYSSSSLDSHALRQVSNCPAWTTRVHEYPAWHPVLGTVVAF